MAIFLSCFDPKNDVFLSIFKKKLELFSLKNWATFNAKVIFLDVWAGTTPHHQPWGTYNSTPTTNASLASSSRKTVENPKLHLPKSHSHHFQSGHSHIRIGERHRVACRVKSKTMCPPVARAPCSPCPGGHRPPPGDPSRPPWCASWCCSRRQGEGSLASTARCRHLKSSVQSD